MKTILVPTDFSKSANNALNYATKLAKKESAKVVILHAYGINLSNERDAFNLKTNKLKEVKKEHIAKLELLLKKTIEDTDIQCETIVVEDYPVEAILNAIDKIRPDMVIMGTKGVTDFPTAVFGSNTAKILEKAKCPVIAVPIEATFNGIKKITYATAFNHCDFYALKNIVEMARLFGAQLNVLHVSDNLSSPDLEVEMMKKFMEEVNSQIQYNDLTFQILSGENVIEALGEYIKSNATNMLVMSTHHLNTFDKLFNQSVTKQMAYNTMIPIMAFHFNEKSYVNVFE